MTDSAIPSNETWDVIRHLFEGGELCGQTNRTDDSDSHVCGCFRKPHADADHVCPCGSRWSTDDHIDGARDEELLGRVWEAQEHADDSYEPRSSDMPDVPRIVGYLCPSRPDGPMIPPRSLIDPCGKDVPVWSDGVMGARNDG